MTDPDRQSLREEVPDHQAAPERLSTWERMRRDPVRKRRDRWRAILLLSAGALLLAIVLSVVHG